MTPTHTPVHTLLLDQVEAGKGRTALYLAAGRGHADMVDLLLQWGADPCIRRSGGWDALSVAASEAHVEVGVGEGGGGCESERGKREGCVYVYWLRLVVVL
jgi:hypothetical protein